jgi:hypothetical protein
MENQTNGNGTVLEHYPLQRRPTYGEIGLKKNGGGSKIRGNKLYFEL